MTTDYRPSDQLIAAVEEYERAQAAAIATRDRLREVVAEELRSEDATTGLVAKHVPWSDETLRGIAREHGIPLKRAPTVRSIKPRKRSGGSSSG